MSIEELRASSSQREAIQGTMQPHLIVAGVGLVLVIITSGAFLYGIQVFWVFPAYAGSLIDSIPQMFKEIFDIVSSFEKLGGGKITGEEFGGMASKILLLIFLLTEISSNAKTLTDVVSLAWVPVKTARTIALRYFQMILAFNILWIVYKVIEWNNMQPYEELAVDYLLLTALLVAVVGVFYLGIDFIGKSILGQHFPLVLVEVSKILPERKIIKIPNLIGGLIELDEDQSILISIEGADSESVNVEPEPHIRWRMNSKVEGKKRLILCDPRDRMRNANINVKFQVEDTEIQLRSYRVTVQGPKKIELSILLKLEDEREQMENITAPMYMNFGEIYENIMKNVVITNDDIENYQISWLLLPSTGEILETNISLRFLEIEEGELIEMGLEKKPLVTKRPADSGTRKSTI